MSMNQISQQIIQKSLSRAASCRRSMVSGRRQGFMALGLILCLILILTVAAVLWSYQYLTIQNFELECAVRSALSAAVKDGTLETYLQKSGAVKTSGSTFQEISAYTDEDLKNSTLQKVLDLTAAQQNRSSSQIKIEVKKAVEKMSSEKSSEKPILGFSQPRELGFTQGVFDEKTRKEAEGTFSQYYEISTDGTSFKKVYSVE
ncbi:MAG: hypothetical protein IJF17_05620 [Thermoguttaceae bacterium]|nr:hypothetical protein [Thermoguttaceae bacterium]